MKAVLTEEIILTEEQLQVLDGAMLGDGSLIIHKQGKNAHFSYVSKSKQHVEFVGNYFKEYWSGEGIKENTYFDKRTEKQYYRSYIKTYTNISFTNQYNRWYPNGMKKIPSDLKLTPLNCLIWYIGDGGFVKSKRSEYIKLSTHCFLKEDLEKIILPQLKQFEPSLMKANIGKDGQQQYCIYIPHRKEQEFLEYIGECPFEDYKYKWEFTPYKNSKPKSHKEHEQEFCEMYKNGMTYYAIAKHFGIEPNAVKYYLKKHNLYQNLK